MVRRAARFVAPRLVAPVGLDVVAGQHGPVVALLAPLVARACEKGEYKGNDGKCHPLPAPKEPPTPPPTW